MIAVIDYEVGNLFSVQNGLKRAGVESVVTRNPKVLDDAKGILLPGVGAVRDAMAHLEKFDLIPVIERNVQKGKPFVGICLGMQLLFDKSYEDGEYDCLSLLKGEVVPFKTDLKVPHMGWNRVKSKQKSPVMEGLEAEYFYFIHSYLLDPKYDENIIAYAEYDGMVPAVVGKENILGMQFHPEKSGRAGVQILKNIDKFIGE